MWHLQTHPNTYLQNFLKVLGSTFIASLTCQNSSIIISKKKYKKAATWWQIDSKKHIRCQGALLEHTDTMPHKHPTQSIKKSKRWKLSPTILSETKKSGVQSYPTCSQQSVTFFRKQQWISSSNSQNLSFITDDPKMRFLWDLNFFVPKPIIQTSDLHLMHHCQNQSPRSSRPSKPHGGSALEPQKMVVIFSNLVCLGPIHFEHPNISGSKKLKGKKPQKHLWIQLTWSTKNDQWTWFTCDFGQGTINPPRKQVILATFLNKVIL